MEAVASFGLWSLWPPPFRRPHGFKHQNRCRKWWWSASYYIIPPTAKIGEKRWKKKWLNHPDGGLVLLSILLTHQRWEQTAETWEILRMQTVDLLTKSPVFVSRDCFPQSERDQSLHTCYYLLSSDDDLMTLRMRITISGPQTNCSSWLPDSVTPWVSKTMGFTWFYYTPNGKIR